MCEGFVVVLWDFFVFVFVGFLGFLFVCFFPRGRDTMFQIIGSCEILVYTVQKM